MGMSFGMPHLPGVGSFRKAHLYPDRISAINTGKTPNGSLLPSKTDVRDSVMGAALDGVVQRLVALRGAFDGLVKNGKIRPCGWRAIAIQVTVLNMNSRFPRRFNRSSL